MKRLSDYEDEAALDLWAELLEPIAEILADKELKDIWANQPKIKVATHILKRHQKEALQVLKAIDNEPITAVSLPKKVIDFIIDAQNTPEFKDFFNSAEQENAASGTSGSATANTGDGDN